MPSFIKSFVAPEGLLTFAFDRITMIQGVICFVSFSDSKSTYYKFRMLKGKEGTWTILDKAACPDWLIVYEKELEKAIIEHKG